MNTLPFFLILVVCLIVYALARDHDQLRADIRSLKDPHHGESMEEWIARMHHVANQGVHEAQMRSEQARKGPKA